MEQSDDKNVIFLFSDIGWEKELAEYNKILSSDKTTDEGFDLIMRHVRDIVLNPELEYRIRDKAAILMHHHSLDAKATACLYEPSPLSSRKRKAI